MSVTRPMPSDVHPVKAREARFSREWIMRPLYGLILAAIAVEADLAGPEYFAAFIAVGAVLAAREWHRMVGEDRALPEVIVSAVSILAALGVMVLKPHAWFAWAIVGAGALGVALLAAVRGDHPVWQGGGVIYIGVPALALVACRAIPPQGAYIMFGIFLVVWATDTGALIAGNLLKGPKLAPALSPNKTWSGTFGGIAAAAAAEAIYVGALGGTVWKGALYGAGLAVVAILGDLFESFVKRRFHRKDSGTIIPGHGGVLDRIDSMLAAALGLAVLVLVFHFDPLFGAQP